MTVQDRENIIHLRNKGVSYGEIARLLNFNENNVASFCRRHGLGGRKKSKIKTHDIMIHSCLECGAAVEQILHRKVKKFCSDKCRMRWWNSHQDSINKKGLIAKRCPVCGTEFKAYESSHKIYCSRKCYGLSKGKDYE